MKIKKIEYLEMVKSTSETIEKGKKRNLTLGIYRLFVRNPEFIKDYVLSSTLIGIIILILSSQFKWNLSFFAYYLVYSLIIIAILNIIKGLVNPIPPRDYDLALLAAEIENIPVYQERITQKSKVIGIKEHKSYSEVKYKLLYNKRMAVFTTCMDKERIENENIQIGTHILITRIITTVPGLKPFGYTATIFKPNKSKSNKKRTPKKRKNRNNLKK